MIGRTMMATSRRARRLVPLLLAATVLGGNVGHAQTSTTTGTTATRPAKEPQGQTSIPNHAPAATTKDMTASTKQDAMVKKMNKDEKTKVEEKGK